MKKSIENVLKIQSKLEELKHELNRIEWTEAECKDQELGIAVDILRQHLDNASGRASTVILRLRKIG